MIESKRAPQPPAKPHIAKTARALQTDLVQPHRDRLASIRQTLEQLVLLPPPRNPQGQATSPRPPLSVKLPKLRYRLLHHSAPTTYRTHQTPVTVRLAV